MKRILFLINESIEKSKSKPFFKTRIFLSFLLIFLMPFIVIKISNLGILSAEYISEAFLEQAIENPMLLIALASIFPAFVFAMIVNLIFGKENNK